MTTAVLPRGRQSKIRIGYQSAFATQQTTGFQELNVYSHNFDRRRNVESDDILGAGLLNNIDARASAPALEEAMGTISAPMDVAQMGFWLKALMGAPSVSGTTTKVYTFTSGSTSIPSMTIEREFVSAAQYETMVGGVVKDMKFQFAQAAGFRSIDMNLVGRQILVPATATIAGTPTVQALSSRVPASIGTLKQSGTAIGRIISGDVTFTNNITLDNYIGDAFVDDAVVESQDCAINVTARYSTDALRNLASVDATLLVPPVQSLSLEYVLSANAGLVLTFPSVRFEPMNVGIQNGKTMTIQLKGRAEGSSGSAMMTAALTNQFATGY
jgi:hypothetical protein